MVAAAVAATAMKEQQQQQQHTQQKQAAPLEKEGSASQDAILKQASDVERAEHRRDRPQGPPCIG